METQQFISLLENHPGRQLRFEYLPGRQVRTDYHITEVKNVQIDATDCGGRSDSWKETIIQLWESPGIEHQGPSLDTRKALAILRRVEAVQPMQPATELKFEYGNPGFHTGQLQVQGYRVSDGHLILEIRPGQTQCKARDLSGIPQAHATSEVNREQAPSTPGSSCC